MRWDSATAECAGHRIGGAGPRRRTPATGSMRLARLRPSSSEVGLAGLFRISFFNPFTPGRLGGNCRPSSGWTFPGKGQALASHSTARHSMLN